MKHLARRQLGHGRDSILNTNILVHEAYLKLNAGQDQDIRNRNQFLRVCSVVMRNVVIDAVRRRQAAKRGGDCVPLTFNEEIFETENQSEELLARVVECRSFTGLTEAETAGALDISERTVRRHWAKARTLLHQMLTA